MSLRMVLFTRASRPSGAQMAWRLFQAGMPPAAVIVEKRGSLIKKRGSFFSLVLTFGFSFLWERLLELARIRGHFYLRKFLGKKFKNPFYLSIEELALDYPVRLHEVEDHNGKETKDLLANLRPDIGILTNTRRIEKEILQIPRHGFLNLHLSALPQYAGLDSIFWALYHGEKEIGVTVHFASPEIDRGDMILQRKVAVSHFDDENSLYEKALWLGTHLMIVALKQVEAGAVQIVPQDSRKASYFSWPTPRERTEFQRRRKKERLSIDPHFLPVAVRVLHLITRMIGGGAQENTLATVRGLVKKGYQVSLITGPSWGSEGEILSEVLEEGLEIIMIPELVREIHPWKDLICFWKLRRIFAEASYDIVHTHTSKAGWLGRLAVHFTRHKGIPIVIHEPHGHVFHSYFSPVLEKLFLAIERQGANWCDRLVALTRVERDEHLALGIGSSEKWVIIPSGVNQKRFGEISSERQREIRSQWEVLPIEKIVGFIGRLSAIKGPQFLIEAIPLILRVFSSVRFLFVGDGEERQSLEAQVSKLGVRDRTIFVGYCREVSDLLAFMDVVVVPSLNEGMGRVIVESGFMGKAVVGTRVGGITDLLSHEETGLLVEPRSPSEIAEAVIRLLHDSALSQKLGENLHRNMLEGFTEDHMVKQVHELYQKLLREKGMGSRISSQEPSVAICK